MNTLEVLFPHEVSAIDVCWWVHVSNAEVLQRSGLSTIGDILRHRRLSLLAMLHAWTLEYQHMMLCVWWWIPIRRKKGQLEKTAGSPSQRLAQQDSGGYQRSTAIYAVEISDRHRSLSGTAVTWNTRRRWWWWWWWRLVSKMEGKTNFSRHLQAVENLDCWMFENHWRRV